MNPARNTDGRADQSPVTTTVDYARARRLLMRRDPVMRELMRRHGACGLAESQHTDPYKALVHSIMSQQLSSKAAATIARRFNELFGGTFPAPAQVLEMPAERLRSVGLSGMKASFIRDLAQRVHDASLRLDLLDAMTDEEVIAELTKVKGIGRWTAEMFLMFRLHRPDVLPVGDLGIINAMRKAYRLRKPPTPQRMMRIAECWRPYRSIGCWYLWASLDNKPVSD
jgi:DNA-3-methyladenine glycosylase II